MSRASIDKPYSQHWKGRFGMNHAQDSTRNEKLESIKGSSESIDTRLETFSGDVNNTGSIGDGSTQLRSICLGYDRINQKARSILVDSDGKVECNNDDLESGVNGTLTNTTLIASRTLLVKDEIVNNQAKLDIIETTLTAIESDMQSLMSGSNSHQNLYTNGSLLAHTFSTTIDMSNHRSLSIFGKTTSTTGTLYLAFSTDNVNYYVATSLTMYLANLNGVYYFGNNFENIGSKYVRVYTTDALSALYMSASFKN